MRYQIRKAMVIGSGVMGAGIVAHLANANIPVYLTDIIPDKLTPAEKKQGLTLADQIVRNRIVNQGFTALKKSRPPSLFSPTKSRLITVGNIEDNLNWAGKVDWIIEAVVENLEIKQQIMALLENVKKQSCIVSTNTSGIPIRSIVKDRSEEFKTSFLGAHFFNPPRYLKLLELIPTVETDPDLMKFMRNFAPRRLGKAVIVCKDTPNFVANRLAVVTGRANLNNIIDNNFSIEEVDAIFGPLLGRPKTAVFRLLDLIGIDVNKYVSANLFESIPHDPFREVFLGSGKKLIDGMFASGFLGNKAGQGFYKKVKALNGKPSYQVLDLDTLEYREKQKPKIPVIEKAKKIKPLKDRLKFLIEKEDRHSRLIWHNLAFSFSYYSNLIPEISDAISDIDKALKDGFFHELGIFEIWDALGVQDTVLKMETDGFKPAPWVQGMINAGAGTFYKPDQNGKLCWDPSKKSYVPIALDPQILNISHRKGKKGLLKESPSASLVDIGDGVLCLEFHSKGNLIDDNVKELCKQALIVLENDFLGLVIGNQGPNFSNGAGISNIIDAIEKKQWEAIENTLKNNQGLISRLRYSAKPIVSAPFGLTLGLGAELALAADRICAAAETNMGLADVRIGLTPAAGGCAELIQRFVSLPMKMAESDPLPYLIKVFQNIAMARISSSAVEAREMGFLTSRDRIVMNSDHLISEAKQMVLALHAAGYATPVPAKSAYAVGNRGLSFLNLRVQNMVWQGIISEYDQNIFSKLAYVLCGGPLSTPQWVAEEYIFELECEAFLSLCGEAKTVERIIHMLKTGKPLRN